MNNILKIEIELKNGKKTTTNFEGTLQDFIDKIQFTNDIGYVKDTEGYYNLVNQIARFKPIGE